MSIQPESSLPQAPNPTALAAAYQVTARWYGNDAQLVWRRITLFITLNTGLVGAWVFTTNHSSGIQVILPFLGICLSVYWFPLICRAWHYQDFQSAMLRAQERALGLDQLGAFSRAFEIRNKADKTETVEISGMLFSAATLDSRYRNRQFMKILIGTFIAIHTALLFSVVLGWSLFAPNK